MSTEERTHHNPLGEGYIVAIVCICLIIGGFAVWISLYPPERIGTTPFEPVTNTEKCGEGTFYHPLNNKCQTFRPLLPFETVENAELIAELEKTIRDIRIDLDGNRVVDRDAKGLPVVKCTAFENEQYSIDRDCQMTMK